MAFELVNGVCCINHCWGDYKQNSIENSVRVDDWTAKLAFITSNVNPEKPGRTTEVHSNVI